MKNQQLPTRPYGKLYYHQVFGPVELAQVFSDDTVLCYTRNMVLPRFSASEIKLIGI